MSEETTWFKPEFYKCTTTRSKWWCITTLSKWCMWMGSACRLSRSSGRYGRVTLLLDVLVLEPLFRRPRDQEASLALHGIPFASPLSAKVSAYANDITVFVSRRLDIKTEKKAVARYEQIAGAKINFDKIEGSRLHAERSGVSLPGPFRWSDGPVRILGVFRTRPPTEAKLVGGTGKVDAQVGTWLQRRLSLKGRVEVCALYIFPLILYRLSVLPLPSNHRLPLQQSLSKLLWGGQRLMVRRHVCSQHPRNGGLGMPDLENNWFAERLAYLGRPSSKNMVWRLKASDTFPHHKSDPIAEGQRKMRGVKHRLSENAVRPFTTFLGPVIFSVSKGTVLGSSGALRYGSSRGSVRLVDGGSSLALELVARFGILEQLRVLTHLGACTERVVPFRLELHTRLSSLPLWLRRNR